MKKRSMAMLATILLMTICAGLALAAEPVLNGVLTRYPGAVRVEGEKVDAYYLSHGWLTRQAAYQSPDDLENVMRWYAAYLPQAEMHETGPCVALRQTQTIIRVLHTITVLLCQLPPGTRFLVKEDVFLSP
jgi:hypothetical protein